MATHKANDVGNSLQRLGGQQENRTIGLDIHDNLPETLHTLKALASEPRLRILAYLTQPFKLSNLTEIATALDMNLATVTLHVNILEEAGLIISDHIPGKRGTQRVCGCFCNWINIHTSPKPKTDSGKLLEYHMPIGAYFDCQVTPTCGMFSEQQQIGRYDDPNSFFEVNRMQAQLLWFHSGFLEYRFPNHLTAAMEPESLSLSMELCSEAPGMHPDWPSDISLWINNVELGTWTSPGDFGGIRGKFTPQWQPTSNTQFGLLKTWHVTPEGTLLDGMSLSEVGLTALDLHQGSYIAVRLGVKEDADHVGGINLFGEKFGNYAQGIKMTMRYHQLK